MHILAHALLMLATIGGWRNHNKPNKLKDGLTVQYVNSPVMLRTDTGLELRSR